MQKEKNVPPHKNTLLFGWRKVVHVLYVVRNFCEIMTFIRVAMPFVPV